MGNVIQFPPKPIEPSREELIKKFMKEVSKYVVFVCIERDIPYSGLSYFLESVAEMLKNDGFPYTQTIFNNLIKDENFLNNVIAQYSATAMVQAFHS